MPEILLHYIWQRGLFRDYPQQTTDGREIEIISAGTHNRDAGPDFMHARLRFIDHEGLSSVQYDWVGNIEIHVNSSDWYKHHHDQDPAYDNIILHVVRNADKPIYNSQGKPIPQCELQYSTDIDYIELMLNEARTMDNAMSVLHCSHTLIQNPMLLTQGWRQALLHQRLECKRQSIMRLLKLTNNSWEEAFYITLARSFGFHTNNIPFEQLAINTPLPYLLKHRNSLFQLTAILMGQSGLISNDERMQKEYEFMQHKFSLKPIDQTMWKKARMRPNNFPEVRLRQFAYLLYKSEFLFSRLMQTDDKDVLVSVFQWDSADGAPRLGASSIDILLINAVIPYKYAYALYRKQDDKAKQSVVLLSSIAAEDNSIIRQWKLLGQTVKSAADSQALLHLYQTYCQPQLCINCDVAYQIFMQNKGALPLRSEKYPI